jgi:hypothetical protein
VVIPSQTTNTDESEEYYVEPVDVPIHTAEHPFCDDMTCPCKEDPDAIQALGEAVQDGRASPADADRIYRGKTI